MEKVARAAHYAHKQGIIHRDIKPANIMLTKDGEPKLMDFGLAKELKGTKISQSGIIVGTPAYMSPEQMEGNVEYRSDVYSLGAVLYEIITGRPPFESETSVKLMMKALEKEPDSPKSINPSISKELEAICLKALAKKPVFRYQNAQDFADDLHRYLVGEPTIARPLSAFCKVQRWMKSNKLLLFGTSSLLLSMVLLSYIMISFWMLDSPRKVFLLFSYEQDLLWNLQIRKNILETFENNLLKVNKDIILKEYYMETKRFSKSSQIQEKAQIAIRQILSWNPDLVITVDDHASSLVIPHFFNTNIQFIFCGLNNEPQAYGFPQSNVTGIREKMLVGQTLDNMPYFLPKASRYVIAVEDSLSGRLALQEIQKDIERHSMYKNVDTMVSESFCEWKQFLKKYEDQVDFVLIPVYLNLKDENLLHIKPPDVMQWIVQNISKPPIGALGFNIEHGALFGVVDTATKQGELAGKYALQILKQNAKAKDLEITSIQRGEFYVNKSTAEKYGIQIPTWIYQFATVFENKEKK